MLAKDEIFDILLKALSYSDGDQVEALMICDFTALTRYSNSIIHQNVAENDAVLYIRTVKGKKTGTAITRLFSEEEIKKAAKKSSQISDVSAENPYFASLPSTEKILSVSWVCEETKSLSPLDRAQWVKKFAGQAKRYGLSTAGTISTGTYQIAIINSLGVNSYFETTRAKFVGVAIEDDNSGYAETSSYSINDLNIDEKSEIAIKKCLEGRNPEEISPGKYRVALERKAVSDLLRMFAYTQFGALAKQEGRSMMADNIGKKIMSEKLTIYDDGNSKDGLILPFDFEGVPKQKVALIERGIPKGVVHDSLSAARDGVKSTGHAMPPGNAGDPYPMNVFMEGSDKKEKDILENIDDGLLITRFHYLNPFLNTKTALFTGTTRYGTFRIKNGKISKPVKNLRFTQSMIEAFNNIEEVSEETEIFNDGGFFTCRVPTMIIRDFNFTGNI